MKKLFVIIFFLITVNVFSQGADSCDYFRIGLYGGMYSTQNATDIEGNNQYLNSVALEGEYVQSRNFAFFIRGIYEFTQIPQNSNGSFTYIDAPSSSRIVFTFGARYYLRDKNIKPYFQIGLNQETNYKSAYSYTYISPGNYEYHSYNSEWYYNYSLNFGVGLNVKLFKNISADVKYDLYKVFSGEYSYFNRYSVIAGIKYNLIY